MADGFLRQAQAALDTDAHGLRNVLGSITRLELEKLLDVPVHQLATDDPMWLRLAIHVDERIAALVALRRALVEISHKEAVKHHLRKEAMTR